MTTHMLRRCVIIVVFALVAAACAGTTTDSTTTTTTAPATTTTVAVTTTTTTTSPPPTTTTTGAPSGTDAIFEAARPYVTSGGDRYDYSVVYDDSGALSVSLPPVWDDLDGTPWTEDDERIGSSLVAADSIDTFYTDFSAPGIFMGVTDGPPDGFGPEDITDNWDYSSSCTLTSTDPISTASLDGRIAVWTDCGETGSSLLTVAGLSPEKTSFTLVVGIVRTEADVEAYTTAIETLTVNRDVGPAMDSSDVVDLVAEYVGDPVADPDVTFAEVRDDSDTLTIRVPSTWADTTGEPWDAGSGESLTAAPDVIGFSETWTTPGVFYGTSEEMAAPEDPGLVLNKYVFEECTYRSRYMFENTLYTGRFDLWTECGGTGTVLVVVEAYRPSSPSVAFLEIQVTSPEDLIGLETVLDTFDVLRQG